MVLDPNRIPANSPPSDPQISIVLPCLDEERTVARCVEKARSFLSNAGLHGEVIVADNGSTDRSVELSTAAGARIVRVRVRGYGAALKAGLRAARAPWLVMGDADDTYDFSALGPFVERLRGGSDLVMGNRFLGGIERGAMPVLHRYFGNPALSLLARLFFGTRCGDVYCGLRALRRDAYDAMALQSDGMEFALEMVVKSALLRMQVSEVPVALSSSPVDRTSHLKTWRDGRRSLRLYLLCAPQWLFLYPGIVLAVSGLIGGTLIALRVGRIHGVRFDVHSMLYCGFATIIGCQAIFFALFSRILGARAGLLPPNSALERGLARFRIEYALALAAVLLAAGLAGSLWAVEEWRRVSFGDLDPFEMLRLVIPSAVALALGCQTAFSGLYLSLLKHYRDAPREEGEPRAP